MWEQNDVQKTQPSEDEAAVRSEKPKRPAPEPPVDAPVSKTTPVSEDVSVKEGSPASDLSPSQPPEPPVGAPISEKTPALNLPRPQSPAHWAVPGDDTPSASENAPRLVIPRVEAVDVPEPIQPDESVLDRGHEPEPEKKDIAVSVAELLETVIIALVAAVLLLTLVCRTGIVEGPSMQSTMYEGDRYLISDLFFRPKQGDIVVFLSPLAEEEEELWIKRVIATAGQTVYINPDDGRVYVDGVALEEEYLHGALTTARNGPNPIVVPENCIFVMGDNRGNSKDSRYAEVGCIDTRRVMGRVIFRFWPMDKIGLVKH